MLNAFRHQREGHLVGAFQSWKGFCAQRLSASKRRTHELIDTALNFKDECSTPFGIKEKDTLESLLPADCTDGAQRLSASKRRTRPVASLICSILRCSTPFGIKEKDTLGRSDGKLATKVLNAFRHQREGHCAIFGSLSKGVVCSTPFGIKEKDTEYLSWPRFLAWLCSTPFGIKEKDTGIATAPPHRLAHVLNAFRHQREGHKASFSVISHIIKGAQRLSASKRRTQNVGKEYWQSSCVLNAFRHQREGHAYNAGNGGENTLCSTPFGIKEKDTPTGVTHHAIRPQCSTPFGIKEKDTRNRA